MLYPIHMFQVQDEVKIFGARLSDWIRSYKFELIHVSIVDLSVYMKYIPIAANMKLDFIYMDDSKGKSI